MIVGQQHIAVRYTVIECIPANSDWGSVVRGRICRQIQKAITDPENRLKYSLPPSQCDDKITLPQLLDRHLALSGRQPYTGNKAWSWSGQMYLLSRKTNVILWGVKLGSAP